MAVGGGRKTVDGRTPFITLTFTLLLFNCNFFFFFKAKCSRVRKKKVNWDNKALVQKNLSEGSKLLLEEESFTTYAAPNGVNPSGFSGMAGFC